MKNRKRSNYNNRITLFVAAAIADLFVYSIAAHAQSLSGTSLTVSGTTALEGDVSITGTSSVLDFYGNSMYFGTSILSGSNQPGVSALFIDGTTGGSTLPTFSLIGTGTSRWSWGYSAHSGTTAPMMTMDPINGMTIYDTSGDSIVLNPNPGASIGSNSLLTQQAAESLFVSSAAISATPYSVALLGGTASGSYSFAGFHATASGNYSTAIGYGSTASWYSNASGYGSNASGLYSNASGYYANASGYGSNASGNYSTASGWYSNASGWVSTASGDYSNASGYYANASGNYSNASGGRSTASGDFSNASGYRSTASGYDSNASGWYANASGYYATASGYRSNASGYDATASGWYSTASGDDSNASGYHSTASGIGSNASGYYATASGDYSMALGYTTATAGNYSTALGNTTSAQGLSQVVIGQFNIQQGDAGTWVPSDDLFQIGNGVDGDHPSNAFVVKKSGDTTINGALAVSGTSASPNKISNGGLIVTGTAVTSGTMTTIVSTGTNQLVLVPQQGDISMGGFTAGAQPQ